MIQKSVGRPSKLTYKTMIKLADSIQHNSTITEACRYTGISRDTFYRYLKSQPVFAEKMVAAKENRNKVPMSFLTIYQNFGCLSLNFIEIDCQKMAFLMQTNGVRSSRIGGKIHGPLLGTFKRKIVNDKSHVLDASRARRRRSEAQDIQCIIPVK